MAVLAHILGRIGLGRVGVHPADRPVEITGDRQVVIDRCGWIVVGELIDPGRDLILIHVGMTGGTLQWTVRAVVVQRRSLRIAGGVDRRGHRIQTVDRLVTALATDILVATGVAHQAGLGRVVERRVGTEIAALLGERRLVAVRAVGLARSQPVIATVGGGTERYRRTHVTHRIDERIGSITPLALIGLVCIDPGHAVIRGTEAEDVDTDVTIGINRHHWIATAIDFDGGHVGVRIRRIPDRVGQVLGAVKAVDLRIQTVDNLLLRPANCGGNIGQRSCTTRIDQAVAADQVVAVLCFPDFLAQLAVAVGAPDTAVLVTHLCNFSIQPATQCGQVARGFCAVDILHRVGVHVATDEAATGVEAVVAVGIDVVTAQRDWIFIHHTIGTVCRVAALATAVAAEAVVEHDHAAFRFIAVLVVNRLGDRRDRELAGRIEGGRLHVRDHVVGMTALTDHRLVAEARALRDIALVGQIGQAVGERARIAVRIEVRIGRIRVVGALHTGVVRGEAGADIVVMQRQHVDRRALQACVPVRIHARHDVVVGQPEVVLQVGHVFQTGAGQWAAVRIGSIRPVPVRAVHIRQTRVRIDRRRRVTALAVRDVDRRGTETDHRLVIAANDGIAGRVFVQRSLHRDIRPHRVFIHRTRVTEEVDGVLERRQRQAQGLPDARRGQHDRQVFQHLGLGVDHGAGVGRERQQVLERAVAGRTHRLQRRARVRRVFHLAGDTETDLVAFQAGITLAFQVGCTGYRIHVDVEVVQPGVGIVVGTGIVSDSAAALDHVLVAVVGPEDQRIIAVRLGRIEHRVEVLQRVAFHRTDQRTGVRLAGVALLARLRIVVIAQLVLFEAVGVVIPVAHHGFAVQAIEAGIGVTLEQAREAVDEVFFG